jgi:pullulanase
VNGTKGVVVDLAQTNPSGWLSHEKPKFSGIATDAVFYELHVRDLSMDPNSGIKNKGKFLGLTEANTTTPDRRTKTGIDAIVDLGITHLQLLPIYDYKTVDENRNDQFNWGYDPLNFNVVEGSYSTIPTDPLNRISELKQTIQYLHSRGVRVVMDVVYNHVFDAGSHSFELLVPGYFFRKEADGTFANGTGVGNEVASERSMASKYIVDSALYWAREYKLDGYRFDLMGILDVDTMNKIRRGVDKIDPAFLIIGEGWNMGSSLFPEKKAYQYNAGKMPRIAHFNDGIRDGLKGSVFKAAENGWASGRKTSKMEVMEGIAGEIYFSSDIRGSWGDAEPEQSVSYVEAHDNLTLFDKLRSSMPKASATERTRVFALASSTAILAQGVTFLHAGQEFMRSKNGDENSYKSSDLVNSMKWTNRAKNKAMVSYFKGLIEIRKQNSVFRMKKGSDVKKILAFSETQADVIAYSLDASVQTNSIATIFVIHNSATTPRTVKLPQKGTWRILAEGLIAKAGGIRTTGSVDSMIVPAQSTMVLALTR